ncbi:glycosyltransferase [Photorhabdus stackebrandtii]|uniref:Glycosyl transferase family 1 domain-containing protein n=1 Tax=Photorhabdus stackebrandtii TaxID=1123042 RepID=A0A7X5QLG7_9GAMM|nr:glycosyltransferase [Photorhabdus stackebrandtii]NHB96446.1 hypothetical protein [Photorhabdus stackebrandtii]
MNQKLCFVIRSFSGGGIETVTTNLANSLAKRGHNITIIVLLPDDEKCYKPYISDKVEIIYDINYYNNKNIFLLSKITNKLFPLVGSYIFSNKFSKSFDNFILEIEEKNGKFNKIYLCGFGVYTILFKTKIKNIVFQCHNTNSRLLCKYHFNKLTLYIFRKILNNKNISAVSKGIADDLVNQLNIKPKKIGVIYNLLDADKIKKLSLSENKIIQKPYIIHVGRFAKEKRHDLLIEAYDAIKTEPKPQLLLLGSGPEEYKIRKIVLKKQLKDNIIFGGMVKNPYPMIKDALALVLCSDYEGLPTVILESIILNTYVISTNCKSGPLEMIINNNIGKLIPLNSTLELSTEIDKICNLTIKRPPSELPHEFTMDYIINKHLSEL